MRKKEKKPEDGPRKYLAVASLIMSKTFIGKRQEEHDGPIEEYVKEVCFDVKEITRKGEEGVIKTPRINLEGSFFKDFLTSGRPEQYEVVLEISARRTEFGHKGIPAVAEEADPEPGTFDDEPPDEDLLTNPA